MCDYIPADASVRHIELINGQIKHDTSTTKGAIGQHSVVLANSFYNSGLEAGGTYRVTFKLKTFPHYTPLESLAADIRFGEDIWTNVIDGATISLTGEDLAAAVTSYSPSSTGSVTFTISLDVTLPETGWSYTYTGSTGKNILLGIWGGEYWLDDVTIATTAQFEVQDESGNHLGYAYGHLGDSTAKIVKGDSFVDAYHTFTLSPATITAYMDVITLTNSLNSNIVELVNFGSETYGGYLNTGSKYYETASGATVTRNGGSMVYNSNSGNSFGYRSAVMANDRFSALLTPGEEYALRIRLGTWDNNFANLSAEIGFGNNCWVSGETIRFSNSQLRDSITAYGSGHVSMSSYDKKDLYLSLKFTVPSSISGNENLVFSLYGANGVNVQTYLYSAVIYSPTEITFNSYDGTVNATAVGFEGDTITEAFDSARNVKVTNFSETFGVADKTVSAGNYQCIERGDSDGDGRVNSRDIIYLRNYLLYGGVAFNVDTFGANANAVTFTDTGIDIKDLVRTKKIVVTPAASADPIAGLAKSGYQLAWSYEFNDNTVDSNYFDAQWGMAHNSSAYDTYNYVGTGDKKCSYVKDGALVISPDGNYGAGNPFICEPYMTKNKMHFTYGYLEICAKIPFGNGTFPALWLKSEKDASDNVWEIDLVETLGSTNNIAVTA